MPPRNVSAMKPEELVRIGQSLFGAQWQSDLARALGRSDRSIRNYAAGERAITAELVAELARLCDRHAAELARVARHLKRNHA